MDYLLWDWRRHNPDMVRVSFVRLSTFAIGRGRSANAEVLAASGLYANVGQQGQAVAEARLLGERVFYMFKREPTLLRWQVVALQDEMLATLNDRKLGLDGTLTNVRGVLTDANALVTSLDQTSHSLNEMFKTTDALLVRYDAIHSSRPFDIREYMETVKEVAVAAEKMNDLLQSSNQLLGSSEWDRRIQQVNQSADERIKIAAEQSQRVVNDLFWRVYVALGVLFAMLILLCLVAVFLVIRRPRIVAGNARDAGRKETSE
jgi:PAS domain-containing protein